MSSRRTVAEVIREHVYLEVEGIDRMYLKRVRAGVAAGRWSRQLFPDSIAVTGLRPAR